VESIYGSTALCWALAAFIVPWFVYTVSRSPWTGDQPVARPLPAPGQHKHRMNAHRHPCLKWNSNTRSQCLSGRRQFMPKTARPLSSAVICGIRCKNSFVRRQAFGLVKAMAEGIDEWCTKKELQPRPPPWETPLHVADRSLIRYTVLVSRAILSSCALLWCRVICIALAWCYSVLIKM
jgi:hypothetical protein